MTASIVAVVAGEKAVITGVTAELPNFNNSSSIFINTELPTLLNNPNVTKITITIFR